MDVVMSPNGVSLTEWSLRDRLGRDLGEVHQLPEPGGYKITAKLGTSLDGVKTTHPTLDSVMTAIAGRMGGACSLDSQDWD